MPGASGITGSGLLWCGAVWSVWLMRCDGCQKWDEYQVRCGVGGEGQEWDEYRVRCGAWCNYVVQRGASHWCAVVRGASGMNGVRCGGCGD